MLHITNGDSAGGTIAECGFGGEVISWRDVLHEGPVPAVLSLRELSRVRVQFIADAAWELPDAVAREFAARDATLATAAQHDEVVLWFEHDLYDQLQLLQVLDWFSSAGLGETRLTLICKAEYLGSLHVRELQARFPLRVPVSRVQLDLARDAWAAFRSPDPMNIIPFLGARSAALPFLGAALLRHLEQFPATGTGLSRSESQALAAIRDGYRRLDDAYIASHQRAEPAVFLGDSVFAGYVAGMSSERVPLVRAATGAPVVVPREHDPTFWNTELALTEAGHTVIQGEADRIALSGIDRWLGGAHLTTDRHWRWDADAQEMKVGDPP